MPPGATIAFASQMDSDGKPAKVTIAYSKVDWYPTKTKPNDYLPFTTNGAKFRASTYSSKVTGMLVNPYGHVWENVAVTALYYDDRGKLIGGTTGFAGRVPAKASKPFELNDLSRLQTRPSRLRTFVMPWVGDPSEWNHVAMGQM